MKSNLKILTIAAVVSAGAINSNAVAFRDVDSFIQNGQGKFINSSTAASGVFSIVNPGDGDTITIGSGYADTGRTYSDVAGFRPGMDLAIDASAYFYVRDDRDSSYEIVNIKLDGLQFEREKSTTATSIVGGDLGGDSWLATAIFLIALNLDGTLKYSVTSGGGDFVLEYARLEVDAIRLFPVNTGGTTGGGGTNVPDGGATVMLFGIGILGLFAAQRARN